MSSSSLSGLWALGGSMSGLCIIFVGLRFYVRLQSSPSLSAADWFAGVALISYLAAIGCVFTLAQQDEFGQPRSDPNTEGDLRSVDEVVIAYRVVLQIVLCSIKLSALFFYRSVFCTPGKTSIFNKMIVLTMGIVVSWLLVFEFLTGFQCGIHISALWDGSYSAHCTLSFPYLYGWAISEIILDVWMLLLPVPSVLQLHASVKTKMSILGVFLLAFIGLGACIARLIQYIEIELAGKSYFLHHSEERSLRSVCYLDMLEAGMSLIAVNLPVLCGSASGQVAKIQRNVIEAVSTKICWMSFMRRNGLTGQQGASDISGSQSYNGIPRRRGDRLGNRFDVHASLESGESGDPHRWRPPCSAIKVHRVVKVTSEQSRSGAGATPVGQASTLNRGDLARVIE